MVSNMLFNTGAELHYILYSWYLNIFICITCHRMSIYVLLKDTFRLQHISNRKRLLIIWALYCTKKRIQLVFVFQKNCSTATKRAKNIHTATTLQWALCCFTERAAAYQYFSMNFNTLAKKTILKGSSALFDEYHLDGVRCWVFAMFICECSSWVLDHYHQ